MEEEIIEIFTDGGCLDNPGPGSWAALLRYKKNEKKISGSLPYTSNNRMEITAAIEALKALKKKSSVIITTDSTYLKDGITSI